MVSDAAARNLGTARTWQEVQIEAFIEAFRLSLFFLCLPFSLLSLLQLLAACDTITYFFLKLLCIWLRDTTFLVPILCHRLFFLVSFAGSASSFNF